MNFNATLIGQMISFGMLVWFVMKYVWPPLIGAMRERQQKIAEGLAAAERGSRAEGVAKTEAEALIKVARAKAADIISQAQKQANDTIEASKAQAKIEGEKQLMAARAEIEREMGLVRDQLRTKLAGLVVSGASKILEKEVNAKTHAKLIDDLAAQL